MRQLTGMGRVQYRYIADYWSADGRYYQIKVLSAKQEVSFRMDKRMYKIKRRIEDG